MIASLAGEMGALPLNAHRAVEGRYLLCAGKVNKHAKLGGTKRNGVASRRRASLLLDLEAGVSET